MSLVVALTHVEAYVFVALLMTSLPEKKPRVLLNDLKASIVAKTCWR